MFILHPYQSARATYVPDPNGQPIWLPLPGEPLAPTLPADTTIDSSDSPAWLTAFGVASAQEVVRYWQGGTFAVSGIWTSYGGEWYAATTAAGEPDDADGDGIPDALDPFPQDASNDSFEWVGGTFQFHGIHHAFRAGLYQGSPADANNDELPDVLVSWFTNPSAHGSLQHWTGGSILIDGEWSTFQPVSYYANAVSDQDGDNLPDEIDPYPSDPWNNSYSAWGPLDTVISGVETHFEESVTPGTGTDTDGDGIPDTADPYPSDATNNSTWWQGGSYWVESVLNYVEFEGRWVATSVGDSNADSIPDEVPLPSEYQSGDTSGSDDNGDSGSESNSEESGADYTWPSESFTIMLGNQPVTFEPAGYSTPWSDEDGDGIPDFADPYPTDYYNGNDTDTDGIPDSVEALYPGLLSPDDSSDVWHYRSDGMTYIQAWQYDPTRPLDQPYEDSADGDGSGSESTTEGDGEDPWTVDSDSDGMPDLWEVSYGLDPYNAQDAAQSLSADRVRLNAKSHFREAVFEAVF